MKDLIVAPSILSCDFSCLASEIDKLNKTSCEWIHFDVMDGHFVKNLTFGAPIIKALRDKSEKVFDVHLMMDYPLDYIKDFVDCGSDYISIHYESIGVKQLGVLHCLKTIRSFGVKSGLVVQPDTNIAEIISYIPYCDQILIMSVYAGFGGQSFIENSLKKISLLHELTKDLTNRPIINVDGGVNDKTVAAIKAAGADAVVSGSYIFSGDYNERVKSLK